MSATWNTGNMIRFSGKALGTWSLRLDALYCLILGTLVATSAPQIATVVALPTPLLLTTGLIVVAWSGLVLWMVFRMRLRLALQLVLGVNVVAAALIAAAALTTSGALVAVAVLAIALDVALFAASQMVAIRRITAQPTPTALA